MMEVIPYYSKLPLQMSKYLDMFYKENPHLYNKHSERFNEFVLRNLYFYEINCEIHRNRHYRYLKNRMKHQIDNEFQYLEKRNDDLFIYYYQGKNLMRLIIILSDGSEEAYMPHQWFATNLWIMYPMNYVSMLGFDPWAYPYNSLTRVIHPESIKIMKSYDRFKYLPIDKIRMINFYRLFQNKELVHQLEILIKMGAIRFSSKYQVSDHLRITLDDLKNVKKYLKKNYSFDYVYNLIQQDKHKQKMKRDKLINKALYKKLDNHLIDSREMYLINDQYILRTPLDHNEIMHEGHILNHCLSSSTHYMNKILNQSSKIYFLRNVESPDEPFYTIETTSNDHMILQFSTFNNRSDNELKRYIQSWFSSQQQRKGEKYEKTKYRLVCNT